MSFQMQLAHQPDGRASYVPLLFRATSASGPGRARMTDPVLAATVGAELEYGSLVAYLFRRFGYPNQPCRAGDEFCRYLLTTPRKDLLLSVAPRVDGRTAQSIEFLGPVHLPGAARAYLLASMEQWEERALAHRAKSGMPDWLQASAQRLRKGLPQNTETRRSAHVWRQALRAATEGPRSGAPQRRQFLRECCRLYAGVEAPPARDGRPAELRDWDARDPLRPFALAAAAALRHLMRDVRVGDAAIDVFGARPAGARTLDVPLQVAADLAFVQL